MRIRVGGVHPILRLAWRISRRLVLVAIVASLFATALPVAARNPNFRICFRQVINVPGPTFLQPPNVNGIINNDLGWTSAFRYVFGNGTPTPDGVVQGIRDNTFLYLSFEVNNDQMFDNEDVIVLTLDPTGVAAAAHRIHIYPVFAGVGAAGNGNPRQTDHWVNSAAWASAPLPATSLIKVTSAGVGPVSYFVEVKLPRAAFSIPAAGDFGIYFNLIRVSAVGQPIGSAVEMYWPTDAPVIGLDLEGNTPPPDTWGNGTLAGTCNGVSIDVADISTNQNPISKIAFPPGSNIFNALVHNNSVDAAGNAIPANQVRATFKIANFGIPAFGDWTLVPTGSNPTAAGNIPANGSATLSTAAWTLTAAQQAEYAAHTHQCILVELDSNNPNTFFVNKSAWRNMDFGAASVHQRTAEISGRFKERPPRGRPSHQIDLYITTRRQALRRDQTGAPIFGPQLSQLTWIANGYRRTGRFIIIKKKRFEIADRAGSFGFFVQHRGPLAGWTHSVTGGGLRRVGNNLFTLQVPHGRAVGVRARAEARQRPVLAPRKTGT